MEAPYVTFGLPVSLFLFLLLFFSFVPFRDRFRPIKLKN